MKKLNLQLIAAGLLLSVFTFGQEQPNAKVEPSGADIIGTAKKSEIFEAPFVSKNRPVSADLEWLPTLASSVHKVDHGFPGEEEIEEMKAEKAEMKYAGEKEIGEETETVYSGSTPVGGTEFNGNPNSGSSPMDNSIAISNGGIIVSVANTTIQYKTMTGGTTFASSLLDFVGDPDIGFICDPVVLYDPQEDRFIFFAQECTGSATNTALLIMFSETNDPADGWNYYRLTGNPLSDGSWFDYPKMGISDGDLFITGNLFYEGGGYNQSIVYQMDKEDGYTGGSLSWQYWFDIPGDPFTILPVSSGNEFNYGPGIYMVATSPFSGTTIKFYDITDNIEGDPELNYYSVSTPFYEVAADAQQLGTSCQLDNGDCRALSGFYMNGIVHFVFQSDVGSGWNGINYNRLDVATLSNTSDKFGNPGVQDYSYPAVAWFGLSPLDKSVMIGFGSVSSSEYPEVRVVNCNNLMEWSETLLIKESTSYACFTNPSTERWGDYTGMARKHDTPEPSVWMNGMYGTSSNRWNTWISEVHAEYFIGIEEEDENDGNASVYPNPAYDTFVLYFETEENMDVNVQLVGVDGRLVKALYTGTAYAGQNNFAFNKANLESGTYILQVLSGDKVIANEKVIIQ